MSVKLLTEHHLEFLSSKRGCRGPITSFSFRPQHSFYWMSPFSLESHLTGEPCLFFFVFLFDLILNVPTSIFQLNRDGSSWVEPVLS